MGNTQISNSEVLRERLFVLGLTGREVDIYFHLLSTPAARASAISKATQIHRVQVYEILNNLVNKGLISIIEGQTKTYRAENPVFVIPKLAEQKLIEAQAQVKSAASIGQKLEQAYLQSRKNNDQSEYTEVIRNPEKMMQRIGELLYSSEKTALTLSRPPHVSSRLRSDGIVPPDRPHDLTCKARNIYEISTELEARFEVILKDASSLKLASHRFHPKLPIKAGIFDSEWVTFVTADNPEREKFGVMIVFRSTGIAQMLTAQFEVLWNEAITSEKYLSQIDNKRR